jgi:hypothetical protein
VVFGNKGWETWRLWKDCSNGVVTADFELRESNGLYDVPAVPGCSAGLIAAGLAAVPWDVERFTDRPTEGRELSAESEWVLGVVLAETGVRDLDIGPPPSPNFTSASTVLSRSPSNPFSIAALRLSSANPMSRKTPSFDSKEPFPSLILIPKVLDSLLGCFWLE